MWICGYFPWDLDGFSGYRLGWLLNYINYIKIWMNISWIWVQIVTVYPSFIGVSASRDWEISGYRLVMAACFFLVKGVIPPLTLDNHSPWAGNRVPRNDRVWQKFWTLLNWICIPLSNWILDKWWQRLIWVWYARLVHIARTLSEFFVTVKSGKWRTIKFLGIPF